MGIPGYVRVYQGILQWYTVYSRGVSPARGCQAKESDPVNYKVHKIYRKNLVFSICYDLQLLVRLRQRVNRGYLRFMDEYVPTRFTADLYIKNYKDLMTDTIG